MGRSIDMWAKYRLGGFEKEISQRSPTNHPRGVGGGIWRV